MKDDWMISDLHIHSRFSRACSKNINFENLVKWAKVKGLDLLGTGDFTHPIWIEEIKKLTVNSKYSTINVEEGGDIQATSRYDKYNCEELESLTIDTKYTQVRIDELAKSLKVEAGYGGIKVGEVADDFESIHITNSYGQISLGLDDAEYMLDASCNYCGISYPEDEFSGDRIKENNTRTVKGKIGTGEGGKVYVRSRYGEIRLN